MKIITFKTYIIEYSTEKTHTHLTTHGYDHFSRAITNIINVFQLLTLGWVTVMMSLIGKFGASAAFAIIYVYSAELFPTVMRNSGMGLSSFSARIGGILAPYIADIVSFLC